MPPNNDPMSTAAPPLPSTSQAAAAPPQSTAPTSAQHHESVAKALTEEFQRACRSHAASAQRIENARLALRKMEEEHGEGAKLLAEKREAGMHAHRVTRAAREAKEEAEMSTFSYNS